MHHVVQLDLRAGHARAHARRSARVDHQRRHLVRVHPRRYQRRGTPIGQVIQVRRGRPRALGRRGKPQWRIRPVHILHLERLRAAGRPAFVQLGEVAVRRRQVHGQSRFDFRPATGGQRTGHPGQPSTRERELLAHVAPPRRHRSVRPVTAREHQAEHHGARRHAVRRIDRRLAREPSRVVGEGGLSRRDCRRETRPAFGVPVGKPIPKQDRGALAIACRTVSPGQRDRPRERASRPLEKRGHPFQSANRMRVPFDEGAIVPQHQADDAEHRLSRRQHRIPTMEVKPCALGDLDLEHRVGQPQVHEWRGIRPRCGGQRRLRERERLGERVALRTQSEEARVERLGAPVRIYAVVTGGPCEGGRHRMAGPERRQEGGHRVAGAVRPGPTHAVTPPSGRSIHRRSRNDSSTALMTS